MNFINFKNPKHVQIIREEIFRVKRILTEGYKFSMDEIWATMSEDERFEALAASRDDIDVAEKYADAKWDNIPDSITDSMDLSDFELAKYDQGGRTNLRAIDSMMSKPGVDKFVTKYLQLIGRSRKNDLTLKQSYDLLTKIHKFNSATSNPMSMPSKSDTDAAKQSWLDAERQAGRTSGLD